MTLRRVVGGFGQVINVSVADDLAGVFSVTATTPTQLGFYEALEVTVAYAPNAAQMDEAVLRIVMDGTPGPLLIPLSGTGISGSQRTEQTSLASREVDLLLVVDDSCSMAPAQTGLAAAVEVLDEVRIERAADVRIGVITTDMDDSSRSGRLIGTPAILDGNTPNLLETLRDRVQPGIDGSGDEQGILAAYTALTPPLVNQDNAGFLRPDADLVVVIVSDENDFSPRSPTISQVIRGLRQAAAMVR